MEQVKQKSSEALVRARTIASYIPVKVRGTIYTVLGLALMLELIWDVIPDPIDGKLQATISALGFGMAALNTGTTNTGEANAD